jgi:hypothetical protein
MIVGGLIGVVALALLMAFICWPLGSYECRSKWERSGFLTDYGPVQGCLISKDGKTWMPAERYRNADVEIE